MNSEESVVQYNPQQICNNLNKVNDLRNLILSMDPDTEKALKINLLIMSRIGNLKTQNHISCNKIKNRAIVEASRGSHLNEIIFHY